MGVVAFGLKPRLSAKSLHFRRLGRKLWLAVTASVALRGRGAARVAIMRLSIFPCSFFLIFSQSITEAACRSHLPPGTTCRPPRDARVAMIAMRLREAQLQRPVDGERIEMLMLVNWVLKQPIVKEWRSTTRNKNVR